MRTFSAISNAISVLIHITTFANNHFPLNCLNFLPVLEKYSFFSRTNPNLFLLDRRFKIQSGGYMPPLASESIEPLTEGAMNTMAESEKQWFRGVWLSESFSSPMFVHFACSFVVVTGPDNWSYYSHSLRFKLCSLLIPPRNISSRGVLWTTYIFKYARDPWLHDPLLYSRCWNVHVFAQETSSITVTSKAKQPVRDAYCNSSHGRNSARFAASGRDRCEVG